MGETLAADETVTGDFPEALAPSEDAIVSVLFLRSRSPSYDAAVGMAQGAERFRWSGKAHLAEWFELDQARATRAAALIRMAGGWKGTMVFAGGRMARSNGLVAQVLMCYADSFAVPDYRAHCNILSRKLYRDRDEEHEPVVVPCKQITAVYPDPFYADHPAGLSDQFAAWAVLMGCDWCPRLVLKP